MKQKIKVISKPGKAGFRMCLHHVKMKKMKKMKKKKTHAHK